jgi:hypothetical protein
MGIDRALRYLCGPETFLYTPSPPTASRSDVRRKHICCFDLPKPLRKVLHTDLVHNVEHFHARSAAPTPFEPILNAVHLYISSLTYLLNLYARSGEEGVLTPRKRFDENSKLQRQEFLGMLSARLDEELGKRLKMVFPNLFGQAQTQTQTHSAGVPMISTISTPTLPLYHHPQSAATTISTSTFVFASTSTATTSSTSAFPPTTAVASAPSSAPVPLSASVHKPLYEPSLISLSTLPPPLPHLFRTLQSKLDSLYLRTATFARSGRPGSRMPLMLPRLSGSLGCKSDAYYPQCRLLQEGALPVMTTETRGQQWCSWSTCSPRNGCNT